MSYEGSIWHGARRKESMGARGIGISGSMKSDGDTVLQALFGRSRFVLAVPESRMIDSFSIRVAPTPREVRNDLSRSAGAGLLDCH